MSKIRSFAKEIGIEVVGNLTRRPDLEIETDLDGRRLSPKGTKIYHDEGGNEWLVGQGNVCVTTHDGAAI